MTDLPPVQTPKRSFPWLKVLLTLSLAGNLMVAGVVGGALLKGNRDDAGRIARDVGLGPYALGFDKGQLRDIGGQLRKERRQVQQNRSELRQSIGVALDLLRAQPFDAAAFEAHLRNQGELAAELQQIGQQTFAHRVAQMSDAERQTYATRLEAGLKRFGRKQRNRD